MDTKTEILQLLLQGDGPEAEAARNLIREERRRHQQKVDELSELLGDEGQQSAKKARRGLLSEAVAINLRKSHPKLLSDEEKEVRRQHVLETTARVDQSAGHVRIDDIVRALDAEGFDLGVNENRRSTTVSNILRHSGQYIKIATGIFRAAK